MLITIWVMGAASGDLDLGAGSDFIARVSIFRSFSLLFLSRLSCLDSKLLLYPTTSHLLSHKDG